MTLTRALTTVLACAAAVVSTLPSPPAQAGGETGFTTIHYEPTPGRDRIFNLPGTLVGPHLSVYGGFWFSFADGLLVLDTEVPDGTVDSRPLLTQQAIGHVAVAASFFDVVALEVGLPILFMADGNTNVFGGLSGAAVGDLAIRVRGKFLGGPFERWGFGGDIAVYAPSGDATALTGDGGVRASLRLTGTLREGPVLASLTLGAMIRGETGEFRGLPLDHELLYGIGAKVKAHEMVNIGLEIQGRTPLSAPFGETGTSPMEALLGPEVVVMEQLSIEAGVGVGLLSGYGSPNWRVFLGIQWIPEKFQVGDIDNDGIKDDKDRCVNDAEDYDGFRDGDGCPELDNDDDDIPDTKDRCPTIAAGDNGSVGCPRNMDTDGDGIRDAADRCPTDAQTSSGRNGCPPGLDNDSDGVLDMDDRCPGQAAKGDGALFGCPPGLDSDGDGLLDAFDKCVHDAAGSGGAAGCPAGLDSDGDGLLDSIDRCPAYAAKGADSAQGCPKGLDSDGDGLLDEFDKCPEYAGTKGKLGCPAGLDSDGDGLLDEFDRCPKYAQDSGGNAGCPAQLDSDGDGLLDMFDKCPNTASTDTVVGCPVGLDSDGDGILDVDDRCPDRAETGGKNGCPAGLDSDGDGILDMDDRCPLVKVGGGSNGCPPGYDSDRDKVDDMADQCLAEMEDGLGDKPKDGCPKTKALKIVDCRLNIADNVFFGTGQSRLKKGAKKVMKSVALAVSRLQSVEKVIVEGHTDSSGAASMNMGLSLRRAKAVAAELKELLKGLTIEPMGMGETKPVADNKTAKGRAQNRRVEFRIEGGKCRKGAQTPSAAP